MATRGFTLKLGLWGVLKVVDVSAHHLSVDDEVALLVNHVRYHEHLHTALHDEEACEFTADLKLVACNVSDRYARLCSASSVISNTARPLPGQTWCLRGLGLPVEPDTVRGAR